MTEAIPPEAIITEEDLDRAAADPEQDIDSLRWLVRQAVRHGLEPPPDLVAEIMHRSEHLSRFWGETEDEI